MIKLPPCQLLQKKMGLAVNNPHTSHLLSLPQVFFVYT